MFDIFDEMDEFNFDFDDLNIISDLTPEDDDYDRISELYAECADFVEVSNDEVIDFLDACNEHNIDWKDMIDKLKDLMEEDEF